MIGKEDQEREDFGSGDGNVIWRKGDDVSKEADSLEDKENGDAANSGESSTNTGESGWDVTDDFGGWNTEPDDAWDTERAAWGGDSW